MRIEDCIERQIKGLWGTDFSDIGIPVIKTNNLSYEGLIDYSDVCKRNITPEQASGNYLQFGDLLIEKSGGTKTHSVGYVSYFDAENDKYLCNNFILALRPKNNIFSKFLFYQIHYKYESGQFFDCFNKTTGIQNLKVKDYLAKEIVLPSLEEQKHIAAVLDKCTALIAKHKLMLEKYDTLIKSRFIEMFGDPVTNPKGWGEVRITELCKTPDDIKCGPFGTQLSKDEYQKTGVPLFGIPQINSSFKILPMDFLTTSKAEKLDDYSLLCGDIAMSRKGNVGKCAIYSGQEKGIIHSDVVRLRVDSSVCNSIYLMNQLHISPKVETQISNVSSGAIMAGINVTKLKNIIVYNPPLSLQNNFAAFVQQINKSKFVVQKSLEKAETLYKSLMQEYFG